MRELTHEETKTVNGGNLFVAGVLGLAGSYNGGKTIGESINRAIADTFSMSPGQAAYYTFNNK